MVAKAGIAAHRIGRLTLAISATEPMPRQRSSFLRRLGRYDLPAIIETCVDATIGDEPVIRIDRLHLDLGEIDEEILPRSFLDPFVIAFSNAMTKARQEAGVDLSTDRADRLADRIEAFLANGIYRPTADQSTPGDALRALIDDAPAGLASLLCSWLDDGRMRERLRRQLGVETFTRLINASGREVGMYEQGSGLVGNTSALIEHVAAEMPSDERPTFGGPRPRKHALLVGPPRAQGPRGSGSDTDAYPSDKADRNALTGPTFDGSRWYVLDHSANAADTSTMDAVARLIRRIERAVKQARRISRKTPTLESLGSISIERIHRVIDRTGRRDAAIILAALDAVASDPSPQASAIATGNGGSRLATRRQTDHVAGLVGAEAQTSLRLDKDYFRRARPARRRSASLAAVQALSELRKRLMTMAATERGPQPDGSIRDDGKNLATVMRTASTVRDADSRRQIDGRLLIDVVASLLNASDDLNRSRVPSPRRRRADPGSMGSAPGADNVASRQIRPNGTRHAVTDGLDWMVPTARRRLIEVHFGRNSFVVLAILDASSGSLERSTAHAILHLAADRRRPRAVLVRSIAVIAADHAGLTIPAYVATVRRRIRSRSVHRLLEGVAREESPPGANRRRETGRFPGPLPNCLRAFLTGQPDGQSTLRAYRPRSYLVRWLRKRPTADRRAIIDRLARREADGIWAWLIAHQAGPDLSARRWAIALDVLLDRRPQRGRSLLVDIASEESRRLGSCSTTRDTGDKIGHRSHLVPGPGNASPGSFGSTLDRIGTRPQLARVMQRDPTRLVHSLRKYRPRTHLVRTLIEETPIGLLHDFAAILAGHEGTVISAWLEAAGRTAGFGAATWRAALTVLLRQRWQRGLAFDQIIQQAARYAKRSQEAYRESVLREAATLYDSTQLGRLQHFAVSAGQARARKRQEATLVQASESIAVRSARAHEVLRFSDGRLFGDGFVSLWRADPGRVLIAIRNATPRSSVIRQLVNSVPISVLCEIVVALAGTRARTLVRLARRADGDLADAIWRAILTSLLPGGTHASAWRPRLATIVADTARLSGLPVEDCRERLLPRVTNSCGTSKKRSMSTISGNKSSEERRPTPARRSRRAKRQIAVDRFFESLSSDVCSPQPDSASRLLASQREADHLPSAPRPIALALRQRIPDLADGSLDRLSQADVVRLVGPLSATIRSIVRALASAASAANLSDGVNATVDGYRIALPILLRRAQGAITPAAFARAFVAILGARTGRSNRAIVVILRAHLNARGLAYRALGAAISPARLKRVFPHRRARKPPMAPSRGDTDLRADSAAIEDLDTIVAHLASCRIQSRRRPHRGEGSFARSDAHGIDDRSAALAYMLWYGSVPPDVTMETSAFIAERMPRSSTDHSDALFAPGPVGLVSRLRSLAICSRADESDGPAMTDPMALIMSALVAGVDLPSTLEGGLRLGIMQSTDDDTLSTVLADALENGSSEMMRRVASLLCGRDLSRRPTRLLARDAAARHARDLFVHILDHGALPWWGPMAQSLPTVATALALDHPRAIARALRTRSDPIKESHAIHALIGAEGVRPLIHALEPKRARVDRDMQAGTRESNPFLDRSGALDRRDAAQATRCGTWIDAVIIAAQSIVADSTAVSIAALETLLTLDRDDRRSTTLTAFAARIAALGDISYERAMSGLSDAPAIVSPVPIHPTPVVSSDTGAVANDTSLESAFALDPVSTVLRCLSVGDVPCDLDATIRAAFDMEPGRTRGAIRSAILHPLSRHRIATLPRPTLTIVLAALLDVRIRALQPLIAVLAVRPQSIDPLLACIASGKRDISDLVDSVRAAAPSRSPSIRSPAGEDARRVMPDLVDAVRVDNAGLVILAPFLPRLFTGLSLVAEDGSLPAQSAQYGAHALQYLVSAETDAPEYRLLLNKVLCGLDIPVPLVASIEMDEAKRTIANSLLHAVTQNWPPLKTTSIEGLRDTFLQREGFLRDGGEAWVLTVTPGPFDMLLDRLPWPLSVVRLRWMTKLLKVEWR